MSASGLLSGQLIQLVELKLSGGIFDEIMRAVIHRGLEQRTGIRQRPFLDLVNSGEEIGLA